MTYVLEKFAVATPNGRGGDAFTRKYSMTFDSIVKVTQNVAGLSLHNMAYALAKLEIAISNGLGGDAFRSYAPAEFESFATSTS